MDRIFKRYSDPFSLIDEVIRNHDFVSWIAEFVDAENEEQVWDVWIHRILDKSFEEFKKDVLRPKSTIPLETTIQDSMSILNNFSPKER